jgi:beta-phosphoglucomutase family hydrolase
VRELDQVSAILFDLDGVITSTAEQHYQAWKATFDELLSRYAGSTSPARPFDRADYNRHVDGLPRLDGVRGVLAARGIALAEGTPDDPANAETVHGIGTRKNELVNRLIREQGVEVYPGSVAFVHHVRQRGLKTAIVSSSRNCAMVLEIAGISDLFDVRVDGEVAAELGLAGKPAPDTFLLAAERLGVRPSGSAVVEDALAGVEAGRAGGFGLVVGVDRVGQAAALRAHGADIVVSDLSVLVD